LGAELSLSRLLLQVGQTLGRESKGASPLRARVPVCHNTRYHTMGMTIAGWDVANPPAVSEMSQSLRTFDLAYHITQFVKHG